MNDYELKQEAKRQRLEDRAARAQGQSNAHSSQARNMADRIPFGQPILVGHHSEGADRRYRGRIDSKMRSSVEAEKKASALQAKADAVGKGGISSDDPDAIEKLTMKLNKLEKVQNEMKAANKLARKDDRDGLVKMGFSQDQVEKLLKRDSRGKNGFESYQLSNNNANIKSTKERIEKLKSAKNDTEFTLKTNLYTYTEDPEENRVMFYFDGKPSPEIRAILKSAAFRWSPSRGAWVRQLTNPAKHAGAAARSEIDAITI